MPAELEREIGFKDYWAVLRRRSGLFFGVLLPILTGGIMLAFGLAPRYESEGVLLVEQSEVPEDLVRPMIPEAAGERVRGITERVLTAENLGEIIRRFGLYPERTDPDEAVREMRRAITVGAEDPASLRNLIGNPENPVAFHVGFRHGDPVIAQQVASELIDLYLRENQRARQEIAAANMAFLAAQAERLKREIAEREVELARFRQENLGRLPELSTMNLQLLDRTERDLDAVESEIRMLRDRIALYEAELAQLSPYNVVLDDNGNPVLSARDRLRQLQRTFAQLSAVYTQDHPDVQRTRREIAMLSAQTGLPGIDRGILESELNARLEELDGLRERYADDHPDVARLERTIANLRAALSESPPPQRATPPPPPPDNPIYIQRQVQLQSTRNELQAALERRDQLRGRLASLEQRVTATPEVQREYDALARGHQQLLDQYADVERKLREAEIAVNLETESKGERFTVLSSPTVPRFPAEPNRIAILLLAFALAFAAAAGAVAIAEATDGTLRSARDVQMLLEIPPLVMIPYIDNDADVRRRRFKRVAVAALACAWVGVTVFVVMNPAG